MNEPRTTTAGEKVIVVSAIVLLVASTRPWFRLELVGRAGRSFGDLHRNGWQDPWAPLSLTAVVIGVALGTVVVAKALGAEELPDRLGPFGWGHVYLAGGVLAFAAVLAKGFGTAGDATPWFQVGLAATGGLVGGGWLTLRKERAPARARARRSSAAHEPRPVARLEAAGVREVALDDVVVPPAAGGGPVPAAAPGWTGAEEPAGPDGPGGSPGGRNGPLWV